MFLLNLLKITTEKQSKKEIENLLDFVSNREREREVFIFCIQKNFNSELYVKKWG